METEKEMTVGKIRLNWHYVIWFKNFTTLFATLVLPFALLAYWNCKTLSVLRRRRRMRNRPFLPSELTIQLQRLQNSEEGEAPITPETAVVSLNQGTFIPASRASSDIGRIYLYIFSKLAHEIH